MANKYMKTNNKHHLSLGKCKSKQDTTSYSLGFFKKDKITNTDEYVDKFNPHPLLVRK